ncbi:MAG TPA: DUF1850 domain-containing protein [Anaeromyxobacter sp.]
MTATLALCLFVGGGLAGRVEAQAFTLSWIHSVEKVRWEEDWRLTPAGLVVAEARVRGTGAGMEPPEGAVLRDGSWHYRPALPPLPEVVLADAGVVPDRELCARGECRPLHAWLRPVDPRAPVTLAVCPAAGDGASRGAP